METIYKEPREKRRRLVLYKNNILHDIDVLSYKLAETSIQGDVKDSVASDSEDALDGSVMGRLMDSREASLRKKLGFCLNEAEIFEVSNSSEPEEQYIYDFHLPVSFKDIELKTAVSLMHDYLVKATLMDWYTHIGTTFGAALSIDVLQLESKVVDIFRKPGFVSHPEMIYCPSYRTR